MNRNGLLGSSALRSIALVGISIGLATPAFAQDAGEDPIATAGDIATVESLPDNDVTSEEETEVVITGSRLRRSEFNSPDPIQIINPELAQAQGQFNTAEMIQSSTIAAGSAQVTSAISSAFVTNGGPGAETISLRGLGAERTLVLLNGRRAGPAGTRGAISAFDLNVLPQSIVQSVEILKTGASSVYGSDAIAGVVNLITKKNTDGLQLDAFSSIPQESGGEQYRVAATWGKDFGNGHILVAADYFKRANFQRQDRDYLECPQEYIFRRDGSRADIVDPRTGSYRCNELAWGHVWTYTADFRQVQRYQYSYGNDNLGAYIPLLNPNNRAWDGLTTPPGFYPVGYDRASTAVDNYYHPMYGLESVIPETDRYTAYVDAAYEVADGVEVGTELLFNRRTTKSTSFRQFWYLTGYTQNFEPGFGDPFTVGWNGPYYISPTAITDHNDSSQRVDYYRGLAWVDADLSADWAVNGYLQYSKSKGTYTQDIIFDDAVDLVNYRTSSCVGTTTPISNRPCVDFDWTRPGFLAGELTQAERDYLFGEDTGRTDYEQWAGELSVAGKLFTLPWSGDVQAAAGIAYRRDEINDTPGEQTRLGNSWGQTSAGITAGHVETKEAFAEAELPLLRDIPAIQSFTLSGSGRVTNVRAVRASDGFTFDDNNNWTYSVGANWQVTDFLRFRARYGTSFRAPALFEQFLASQSSFLTQRQVDPCIGYGLPTATQNDRVKANCAAAGIPGNHTGTGPSVTVFQGGGIGVLEPETSSAKSFSAVLTPRFGFLPNTRINIAVDYFDIDIEGEIATLTAGNIVSGCYNSEFFPDEPLCDLFTRLPAGVGGQYNVDEVQATFININRQRNRGVDVTTNIEQGLGRYGTLSFLGQMTWQIEDEVSLFNNTSVDNTGEAGEPRFVGDFNFVYKPNDTVSVFYGLDVVGATSDEQDYVDIVGDLCRTTAVYGEFCVDLKAEKRLYHSISSTLSLDNFDITLGVSNLFDKKPPRVTVAGGNSLNQGTISTIGQSVFASQYDLLGRRFFLNVSARF